MLKIKASSEFKSIYENGRKYVFKDFVVFLRENSLNVLRFGFTVSKKVGGAVVRNKTKRRMNAAFSGVFSNTAIGCDLVFVARKPAAENHYQKIIQRFEHIKDLVSKSF